MLMCLFVSYFEPGGNLRTVLLQIVCRRRESRSERILQIGQCGAKIRQNL